MPLTRRDVIATCVAAALVLASPLAAAPTFSRTYGGPTEWEEATAVVATADGGFLLAGNVGPGATGPFDAWILKADAAGDVEWTRRITGPLHVAGAAAVASDGGLLLVGSIEDGAPGAPDAWLARLAPDGSIVWQERLDASPGPDAAFAIAAVPGSSDFVVAGTTDALATGNSDGWMLRVRDSGAVSWQLSMGGLGADEFTAVAPLRDGAFAFAGATRPTAASRPEVWLVVAEADGTVRRQLALDAGTVTVHGVVSLHAGEVLVVGSYIVSRRNGIALAFSADGALVDGSRAALAGSSEITAVLPSGLVPLGTNESAVVVGWHWPFGQPAPLPWTAHAARASPFGLAAGATHGVAGEDAILSCVTRLPDGPVFAAGRAAAAPGGPADALVMRLGDVEILSPSCDIPTANGGWFPAMSPRQTTFVTAPTSMTPTATGNSLVPEVATMAESCSGCSGDAFEPDAPCSATTPLLAPGLPRRHDFCDDAQDWIGFVTCSGDTYTIDLIPVGAQAGVNVELRTPDCTLILADSDGGSASLTFTARVGGIYLAWVRPADGQTGPGHEYDVVLSQGGSCPVDQWWLALEGTGTYEYRGVAPTADGGQVAVGRSQLFLLRGIDYERQFEGLVTRTDSAGGVSWSRLAAGLAATDEVLEDVVVLTDGRLAVAGRTATAASGDEAWVAVLEPDGSLSWQSTLGGPGADGFVALAATPDGGFVAVGATEGDAASGQQALVARWDAAGGVAWQVVIGDSGDDTASDVVLLTSGEIAIVGTAITGAAGETGMLEITLDATGAPVRLALRQDAAPVTSLGRSVVATPSGGALFVGQAVRSGVSGDLLLHLVDASGGDLARALVAWPSTEQWVVTAAGPATPVGFLVAAQEVVTDQATRLVASRTALLNLDGALAPQWTRLMDPPGNFGYEVAALEDVALATPDGILGVGRVDGAGSGAWLLRTDSTGSPGSTCALVESLTLAAVPDGAAWVAPGLQPVAAGLVLGPPAVAWEDVVLVAREECQEVASWTCADVQALIDSALPSPADCSTFTLTGSGTGEGALTFEWDLDHDGVTFDVDATGVTAVVTLAPGPLTVALRVTDSCPVPGPQSQVATTLLTFQAIPDPVILEWCDGTDVILDAGAGYLTYAWTTGATSRFLNVGQDRATTFTVTVTGAGACTATTSLVPTLDCLAVPGEVSDVRAGETPLLVRRSVADTVSLIAEDEPGATAYNLHAGAIGTWSMPTAASGTACTLRAFTVNGDGTVTLDASLSPGTWFVVSASNTAGEGPVGRDSQGRLRPLFGVWPPCGAAP